MKVIFLDIDGVLNNRFSWKRRKEYYDKYGLFISSIDEEAVKRLSKIVEITGAKIVLSSSWRYKWLERDKLEAKELECLFDLFKKYNIEIVGITPCIPKSCNLNEKYTSWRENEILFYLVNSPLIESFSIIDDELFDLESLKKYLVKTDIEYGLQDEHIEESVRILKQKILYRK